MQVAFHLGAPCSGQDALYASLQRSREILASHSVAIADPDEPSRAAGTPVTEGRVLRRFREEGVRRVLVCENCSQELPGFSSQPLGDGLLYPLAGPQAEMLAMLFPEDVEIEFHVAVRSPATLLPTLICQGDPAATALAGDPGAMAGLSWADVIRRLRQAAPRALVVVWCDEDMPLIWPEVVERVAGISGTGDSGFLDRLSQLLTEDGLERLRLYLSSHPPRDAEQRRMIVSSFLTRFGRPEAIEMELDLPGWTPESVAAISDAYDADVERIAAMENVELIQP